MSPLRAFDNVILSPHVGGSTQEAQYAIGLEVAEKLVKYHGRTGPWWKKLAINCMEQFRPNQQARLEFTQQYLECYQFAIDNPASNPDQ